MLGGNMIMTDDFPYADILELPHHVSSNHPRMSHDERAAQFSPFAALTGYAGAIAEASRVTAPKRELGEDELHKLNRTLQAVAARVHQRPRVKVTYYQADKQKDGGCYLTLTGLVKKLDEYAQYVLLDSGEKIAFSDIFSLELIKKADSLTGKED